MHAGLGLVLVALAAACLDEHGSPGKFCTPGTCSGTMACVVTPEGPLRAPCEHGCFGGDCVFPADPKCPTDQPVTEGIAVGYCDGLEVKVCSMQRVSTTLLCTSACASTDVTGFAACVLAATEPACNGSPSMVYRRCVGTTSIVCLGAGRRTVAATDCAAMGKTCSASDPTCH